MSGLGVDRDAFLELGTNPKEPTAGSSITVFGLQAAKCRNGVSQRHGEVAHHMCSNLWPDRKQEEVPIEAITNGVHLPSSIDATWPQPLADE